MDVQKSKTRLAIIEGLNQVLHVILMQLERYQNLIMFMNCVSALRLIRGNL